MLAFHTHAQPSAASYEIVRDLLPLVSKKSPKVRPLRSVGRARRTIPLHPNGHRRNLTAPLEFCHPNHSIRLRAVPVPTGQIDPLRRADDFQTWLNQIQPVADRVGAVDAWVNQGLAEAIGLHEDALCKAGLTP